MFKKGALAFCLLFMISLVLAQSISLDIRINKESYSSGENASYRVILLENNQPISVPLEVSISDIYDKQSFKQNATSNQEQFFTIEKEFISGYWKVETSYENRTVKRFFSVGTREEAEFSIKGDKLIIKNTGNVPYTKSVQIIIGDKPVTQKQSIDIGSYKEIKLIAPNGNYDIKVSDGEKTISENDIYIAGTGNVIGAIDQELVGKQPIFGGLSNTESGLSVSRNSTVLYTFIIVVLALSVLLGIERFMIKKKSRITSNVSQKKSIKK